MSINRKDYNFFLSYFSYCMHPNLCSIPESWYCESCLYQSMIHRDSCHPENSSHCEEEAQYSTRREKLWAIGCEVHDAIKKVGSPSLPNEKIEQCDDVDAHLAYSVDLKWKQAVDFPLLNVRTVEDSAITNEIDDYKVDMEIDMVGGNIVGTVDVCFRFSKEASHHEVDMEVDMLGGNEVGIVDVCLTGKTTTLCWDSSDNPSEHLFSSVHSDQPAKENVLTTHLHPVRAPQSNFNASGFSGEVASDVADKGADALSSMKMSPGAHLVDAPPGLSDLAEGDFSEKVK